MQLVWAGFAAFFVVSLGVGVRLLALARRTRRAPELLVGLAVLGIGPVGFGLQAVASLPELADFAEALAATSAAALALGWGAGEAFAYWGSLRRRARLGLADPVLVNRFLMWAVSASAAALGTVIGVGASLATGEAMLALPAVLASSSAFGFVAALGMWLAFAPPRAYVAWIAGARARA
jgi:hypothetical protein